MRMWWAPVLTLAPPAACVKRKPRMTTKAAGLFTLKPADPRISAPPTFSAAMVMGLAAVPCRVTLMAPVVVYTPLTSRMVSPAMAELMRDCISEMEVTRKVRPPGGGSAGVTTRSQAAAVPDGVAAVKAAQELRLVTPACSLRKAKLEPMVRSDSPGGVTKAE